MFRFVTIQNCQGIAALLKMVARIQRASLTEDSHPIEHKQFLKFVVSSVVATVKGEKFQFFAVHIKLWDRLL